MSEIFEYAAGIFLRPRFGISLGLWDNFSELGVIRTRNKLAYAHTKLVLGHALKAMIM